MDTDIKEAYLNYKQGLYYDALKIIENKEDVKSLNLLGEIHLYGLGVSQDRTKGEHYHTLACSLGNADSCYHLAKYYYHHAKNTKELRIMESLLEKAVNDNHAEAMILEAKRIFKHADDLASKLKAIKLLERAISQNVSKAMVELGKIYLDDDIMKDKTKALKLFTKAAISYQEGEAYYHLAMDKLKEESRQKDRTQAVNYLFKSAQLKHREAEFSMAMLLIKDRVTANYPIEYALEYLLSSHKKGEKKALKYLNILHELAIHVLEVKKLENSKHAIEYECLHTKLSHQKFTCLYILIRLMLEKIIESNLINVLDWMKTLNDDAHYPWGYYAMGLALKQGSITKVDYENAMKFFILASLRKLHKGIYEIMDMVYHVGYEHKDLDEKTLDGLMDLIRNETL